MGNSNKTPANITRKDIETEIKTTITNLNENITDIIKKQITNTTMEIINKNAQDISQKTSAKNTFTGRDIKVTGHGKVTINQMVDVKVTNQAVSNITQDSKGMANIAAQITTDVLNKIQNDNTLKQSLQAASDLNKATSKAGGLSDMVDSVFSTMGSVLKQGSPITNEDVTNIKNKVMMNISNTTINKNKIEDSVESNIKSKIEQESSASCEIVTNAENVMTVRDINADEYGEVELLQVGNVSALNSCILGAVQTTELVTQITTNNETTTTTDTANKAATDQKMDSTTKITETSKTDDAFGKMITSLNPFYTFGQMGGSICIGVCGIICIIIIGLLIYMMIPKGSSSGNDNGAQYDNDAGVDAGNSSVDAGN